ncbi:MAG: flagellar motor protein MotB [Desulfovibrio sp.]|nr:MAG: flagellar motor protein MotB [Desulfovibrio sp.]
MARKKKKSSGLQAGAWMVTFSDLMTLLLTFFVLLLTMSSMDKSIFTKVNMFMNDVGFVTPRGAGRIPTTYKLILDLLENPLELSQKPDRFKELLFPDDVLPQEISRSTLNENILVLERDDGVALVLTDKLLFAPGSSELSPQALEILKPVAEVLAYMYSDVNISAHSDNPPGVRSDNLELSGDRALAVLKYFLESGLDPIRFSLSGYGPYWPIETPDLNEDVNFNRRVEILVKTNSHIGGY